VVENLKLKIKFYLVPTALFIGDKSQLRPLYIYIFTIHRL